MFGLMRISKHIELMNTTITDHNREAAELIHKLNGLKSENDWLKLEVERLTNVVSKYEKKAKAKAKKA